MHILHLNWYLLLVVGIDYMSIIRSAWKLFAKHSKATLPIKSPTACASFNLNIKLTLLYRYLSRIFAQIDAMAIKPLKLNWHYIDATKCRNTIDPATLCGTPIGHPGTSTVCICIAYSYRNGQIDQRCLIHINLVRNSVELGHLI